MPNNQAQDAYNPDRIGSEFEKHLFEELNEIRIGDRQETWKVKTYKMRDGWNVD